MKCPKCHSENPEDTIYCGKCAAPLSARPAQRSGPTDNDVAFSRTKTLETPKEELTRGTIFASRYEIIEELGKGGMGKVYRVEDKKIKEEVALKLIKSAIAADKKTIERFSNELKFARKIAHRNVCRMFDLGEEKGTHFITMEYVSGENLKSSIRRFGQLPIGKSISIAKQICEGLTEAHRLGVIHRDLKPNNIMIDREGNARIMDFGIARSLKAKGITGEGIMVGTPEYMSPEQVEAKEVDQRSDIYSLGVILYEMVTGRLPFEGDTPLIIAMKHKSEAPPNPKKLNPQIPDDLGSVILRCMEKDTEKRYQTAEELLSELNKTEKSIYPRRKDFAPGKSEKDKREERIWKHSIAVLPFDDLSPQKDQEYFCDGMAEELINALTKIKDLRIVARTSSFAFRGEKKDIRDIGKKLNVETLLEGSLRKAGNRVRITAQLINVDDGFHLWSERYDRNMEDVFAIQDDITAEILNKLKAEFAMPHKLQKERHSYNMEAYDLYLKGRYYWNKFSPESIEKAIAYYEQAIEKDPDLALAYAAIAEAYVSLSMGFAKFASKDAMPKAREAAERALQLNPTLTEAHVSLGLIATLYDWDRKSANKAFRRAIELNPNNASAHMWIEMYLTFLEGKFDEAISELERAQELDPLNLLIKVRLGYMSIYLYDFDRALKQFQKVVDLEPNFPLGHLSLMDAYGQKCMFDEAIAEGEIALELGGTAVAHMGVLGYYCALAGKKERANELLLELKERSQKGYVSSVWAAVIYFGLGEIDQAFEWFEKAYEERDGNLIYLTVAPPFDPLRTDVRFKRLLKKMGLENLLDK